MILFAGNNLHTPTLGQEWLLSLCEREVFARQWNLCRGTKKLRNVLNMNLYFVRNNAWRFSLRAQWALCNTLILILCTYCKIYAFQQQRRRGG